jgi:signal transduction histidine kinase
MIKTKVIQFHYALLIFAISLLSFWCFKTLILGLGQSGTLTDYSSLLFHFSFKPVILSLFFSLVITVVALYLFERYHHWATDLTLALNRMAAGHWEAITPGSSNPMVIAYNEAVCNLNRLVAEQEQQKDSLRRDISRHTEALQDSSTRLNLVMQDLKTAQAQMAQSEKHRSLSAVVSGFAHEINNPLTGILGYIELMELQTDLGEASRKRLGSIKFQALRIKDIITELSQLDPDGKQVKMPINLCNLLEKLIKITLSKHDSQQVSLETRFCSKEILIFGNHYSLWQVFEGLIENAFEACMENVPNAGSILIETRFMPDSKVMILVRDNGGGFREPSKAFDPFYTTKSRTQKRGIGLSLAYKIVLEHKGTIVIKNIDNGAAVTITLPLQTPPMESDKK